MEQRMVIVGAGIAGLSTGCYARMNGYRTVIHETHTIPGGLCTAWMRAGYTFDISMHMLVGSRGGPFGQMWQELGIARDQEYCYHSEIGRIESGEKNLTLWADAGRLEDQMLALSPPDARLTREFVRLLAGKGMLDSVSLKPPELKGPIDGLKMLVAILPLMGTFRKYGRLTIQEFAQRFQDPFLRDAVRFIVDAPGWPMPRYPMVALTGWLKSAALEAGVPLGGSQGVIRQIVDHYQKLGGEICCGSRVTDVIIQDGRAVGVRLEDGTEQKADVVVWAGDGHTVIFDILGGRYLSDEIRRIYKEWIPVAPMLHVMLGVARDMSGEPHRIVFKPKEPINIAGEDHHWLCVIHHCFDPSMAPRGKSAMEVWYATRYDYWAELARDRARYEEEKRRIADLTIAALDRRWPGLASQVEVVDVPTPSTYVRYTGNWQGSPDGWYITVDNMREQTPVRSLPGLSGFQMVGQWTRPFSGTVMAALSGRELVQLLCKRGGRPFVRGA